MFWVGLELAVMGYVNTRYACNCENTMLRIHNKIKGKIYFENALKYAVRIIWTRRKKRL